MLQGGSGEWIGAAGGETGGRKDIDFRIRDGGFRRGHRVDGGGWGRKACWRRVRGSVGWFWRRQRAYARCYLLARLRRCSLRAGGDSQRDACLARASMSAGRLFGSCWVRSTQIRNERKTANEEL